MVRRVMKMAVASTSSIIINMDAALYRAAQERGLGEAKTDEATFDFGGHQYVAQGFAHGILFAEVEHWDDVQQTHW